MVVVHLNPELIQNMIKALGQRNETHGTAYSDVEGTALEKWLLWIDLSDARSFRAELIFFDSQCNFAHVTPNNGSRAGEQTVPDDDEQGGEMDSRDAAIGHLSHREEK